jgi:S1-C subfamily serine protease
MALGVYPIERIETKEGLLLSMQVVAAEPVADIAVLAEPNNQAYYHEADAFRKFCKATAGVLIRSEELPLDEPVNVHILTHENEWIAASATRLPGGIVSIDSKSPIRGGTSGGPVVDDSGHLVGVISHASEGDQDCVGAIPVVFQALPRWLSDRIVRAQTKEAH